MESGERVYHTPDSRWYERTEIDTGAGERWFCTAQEAVDAGWRAPKTVQTEPTVTEVPQGATADCRAVVNVNSAGVAELEMLHGIGPVKARAIIDFRDKHGEFESVEKLVDVHGIGEKILQKIAPCLVLQ